MKRNVKITLDSENQELNKIIINNVDMTDYVTRIKLDWSADEINKLTIEFIN